jgi:hypothetical protein
VSEVENERPLARITKNAFSVGSQRLPSNNQQLRVEVTLDAAT